MIIPPMKIVVVGDVMGRADLINQYLEESQADMALSTGDIGIFAYDQKLPKGFKENQFSDYLTGYKKFIKPFITVYGEHDNFGLVKAMYDYRINIENFLLLKNTHEITFDMTTIKGIGGSYSNTVYKNGRNCKEDSRNFSRAEVEVAKQNKAQILLLHDLIGPISKKEIIFSEETYSILDHIQPYYCFIGRRDWFGHVQLFETTRAVVMPRAEKGYLLLDNETWDASYHANNIKISGDK